MNFAGEVMLGLDVNYGGELARRDITSPVNPTDQHRSRDYCEAAELRCNVLL
jgi:hypothetical protein